MNTTLHYHTALPGLDNGKVPDWVHLLPAGEFSGADGRGPYRVSDARALITHSMQAEGGKLPIDENHATDHALVSGGPAPAVGWIVELQARADGIWGRVDWTKSGRTMVADHAYRGISPAFAAPDGVVTRIARASLTNAPNLKINTLHTTQKEPAMLPLEDVLKALGLPATTTKEQVIARLKEMKGCMTMHSQLAPLAGLDADATPEALVTGLRAKLTDVSTHSQQQIEALTGQIAELKKAGALTASTHAVEQVARTKVISDETKADLIALHTTNPQAAERIISGLQDVPSSGLNLNTRKVPTAGSGSAELAAMDDAFGTTEDEVKKWEASNARR
ncbi:hypothetical protein CFR78_04255 [Komagataeibacter rhaeticus]|uniref:phage protease n=1 Tax=Komagataeibacter rhaeticus TaxID=215221 RepID=UPI0006897112|nr:phage protease [Komagataeibacter rhaeticus]PYD54188.1 hypothetical protein CFR78_04255 [Komagataeibacter rhaeticus]GBQ15233.1 hypothetical protein AA16663_2029 [Komagataeibacter rhaeticus DSM 16663]